MRLWSCLALALSVGISACAPEQSPGPPVAAPTAPAFASDAVKPLPDPLPEIAGRVDGVPIPTALVAAAAEGVPPRALSPAERPVAYRGSLNQLVIRELLFQEAKRRQVLAGDETVDAGIAETRKALGSAAAYDAFLKARGFDQASYREDVRKAKSVGRLAAEVSRSLPPASDGEVQAYYAAVPAEFNRDEGLRARHLLFRVLPGATADQKEAARKRCEAALQKLKGGADFAELARQVSEDPGSARNGGDLGEFTRHRMVKAFDDAAFALKAGELSGVVESEFGFHVIKVEARLPPVHQSLTEAGPAIRSKLQALRTNQAMQKLVDELRTKAKIEILI